MKGSIEYQELQKFKATAGGVRKVENVKVDIQGEKATAKADMDTWCKFLDNKGKSIDSTGGIMHYEFTLIKKDGKWKIIKEDAYYLPGQGP